jgi:ubiquinone/menaquinone biosynthesis C-methylase UbiE
MMMPLPPDEYDAWYVTARGAWMGETEAKSLIRLGEIGPGSTLLDAGCGTGWFSRRFAQAGGQVTGLDRDPAMLAYARSLGRGVDYLEGDMLALPLPDKSFDVVTAVTSLCFVREEARALAEMLRVAKRQVLLGLLHRHSLLYRRKHGHGAYTGAHWHTRAEIKRLAAAFPEIRRCRIETTLFWPGGPGMGRMLERVPGLKYFGGFMAVKLEL